MSDDSLPFPVSFVYLAPDGSEAVDTQFQALCAFVPRVGEMVMPQAGSRKVLVHSVYYKIVTAPDSSGVFVMYPTVVLKEPRQ